MREEEGAEEGVYEELRGLPRHVQVLLHRVRHEGDGAPLAQFSELTPRSRRGVRDRGWSLWRLLDHSPQFACGELIYTDVKERG